MFGARGSGEAKGWNTLRRQSLSPISIPPIPGKIKIRIRNILQLNFENFLHFGIRPAAAVILRCIESPIQLHDVICQKTMTLKCQIISFKMSHWRYFQKNTYIATNKNYNFHHYCPVLSTTCFGHVRAFSGNNKY